MAKKAYRTETQEQPVIEGPALGELVWLYMFEHGRRTEHIARVDKRYTDGTCDLSFQVFGEVGRDYLDNVSTLRSDSAGSGWVRVKS